MRFRFHGTRGSLPAPGPDTVRFGGNTTCIEIRSGSGDLIVLDAGTGIRGLGIELMQSPPEACHVFITHTHWDHIQGLPFFAPLFVPGSAVTLYGPPDPLAMTGIEAVLTKQMAYPHFPIREAELKADIGYETLADGQAVDLGFATVTAMLMNHPAMDFGFKVECDGKALFFTGDHEPFYNIYAPGEADFDDYERVVRGRPGYAGFPARRGRVHRRRPVYRGGIRHAQGLGPFRLRARPGHGAGGGRRPHLSDPP